MMDIRPLRNPADYAWALEQVEPYFAREPEPGTPDGDRFDVLSVLIEAYEARFEAVPGADPIDVLRFAIENFGRSRAQLAEIIGSRSRAAEVLDRRKPLTLDMIRAICAAWHLPVESLIQSYALDRATA